MHTYLKILLSLSAIVGGSSALASRATLIPIIPVPGSISTAVSGINDNNIIVGSYTTPDGREHGYFGTLEGNYTTFDVGTEGTQPRSINNDGYIVGFSNSSQVGHPHLLKEFERMPDGSIASITKHGTQILGIVQGINNGHDEFVGDDAASDALISGYYGKNGRYKASLTLPFDTNLTRPRGINRANVAVGFFRNSDGTNSGFLLQNGVVTVVNDPDPSAQNTFLEGINDKGLATGIWTSGGSQQFAFTLDTATNVFTPISVPNAAYVEAFGVNRAGLVAVISDVGAFIYCPKRKSKCPSNGQNAISKQSPVGNAILRRPF